jgi:hypothetical protein
MISKSTHFSQLFLTGFLLFRRELRSIGMTALCATAVRFISPPPWFVMMVPLQKFRLRIFFSRNFFSFCFFHTKQETKKPTELEKEKENEGVSGEASNDSSAKDCH